MVLKRRFLILRNTIKQTKIQAYESKIIKKEESMDGQSQKSINKFAPGETPSTRQLLGHTGRNYDREKTNNSQASVGSSEHRQASQSDSNSQHLPSKEHNSAVNRL